MVAATQRAPSHEGAPQRSTHAGAVGLLRKDNRRGGKSPVLTLDVTLDKLERMCISSASSRRASSMASRGKDGWLGSSPTSLIARRRNRAGQHALQSIDTPIVIVDGCPPPSACEIPNAPRSGQGWSSGYLSDEAMLPPMPISNSSSTSSQGGGKGGSGQPALFLIDVSPSPSP
mmetsp:Transcript_52146/g.129904  ORF Transcript_52146/g.129904 Transcript_52146/m.129904 type:complete len:174 (+) Transcript_52146:283-804(+)|eukprot:CAMPEP_0173470876 /NCGR_PEP_ID=MMETSP1357-20121228/78107_1 /TAXON_ID=77926 /ORGANISM="Hemiselmis rufescens, Strain PCC563" /LENGTH=173 /DNA_ID=CAMNT_0014439171 /DNA_START=278 /DNA_END=799 /DNA_ORIENTATION=+